MSKVKKILCAILIVFTLGLCLTGCSRKQQLLDVLPDNFEVIEMFNEGGIQYSAIVYDKNTKVQYLVVKLGSSRMMTVLVDADGKPLLYEGKE